MSNFTTNWKFLEKLEEAGKLELGRGELGAGRRACAASWNRLGELEKICKILHKLETLCESNICISWKLDKLEPFTVKQAGNFKIIKFIFINKFLFLFNFKK